jgi:tRNA-Thr(GGU) m(6)t(6)A37 methyltransferase TsaA
MNSQPAEMTIRPIGIVRSPVKQRQHPGYAWQQVEAEIVIDDSLTEDLEGLEGFSHLIVIYRLHLATDKARMASRVHPRGEKDLPLVGRLATRSPYRPNSLGQKVVRLVERQGNVLKVRGLDALDGTPVIDIKPYIPGYDSADDATVPPWTHHHHHRR